LQVVSSVSSFVRCVLKQLLEHAVVVLQALLQCTSLICSQAQTEESIRIEEVVHIRAVEIVVHGQVVG